MAHATETEACATTTEEHASKLKYKQCATETEAWVTECNAHVTKTEA